MYFGDDFGWNVVLYCTKRCHTSNDKKSTIFFPKIQKIYANYKPVIKEKKSKAKI